MERETLKQFVRDRILGTRRGSDEPAFEHSVRVSDTLEQYGYAEEVVIAGLLHDVLEDSETTVEELKTMGVSVRILQLVQLATHDAGIQGSDRRLVEMIGKIISCGDTDALAIKVADVLDNLRGCVTLDPVRRQNMRFMKAPLLRNVSAGYVKESLWDALCDEIQRAFEEEGVHLEK